MNTVIFGGESMVKRRDLSIEIADSLEQAKKLIEVETQMRARQNFTPAYTHVTMFVTGKFKKRWRSGGVEYEEETFDTRFLVIQLFEEVDNNERRLDSSGIRKGRTRK